MQEFIRGDQVIREFYESASEALLHEKMDERAAQLGSQGFELRKRRKVGRNESCPCGSGRKFKRCCLSLAR